ncbi:MAG: glutathione S-transferase [Cycloclasticus sp. symbiont of Bathymodiolus heckerae]|nr:MAG: glutathione S-transferase [Cycloclasticus sp. symbiont of Bathymodiolus heckerae]
MIKLYQFSRTWGLPNLGHFNVKVETYLRMAKISYDIVETLPLKAPKGKLPYIEDDGEYVADSSFILEYLKTKYGDVLDERLSEKERATSLTIQRLLEEHLYWVGMYTRWQYSDVNWQVNKKAIFGSMPPLVRDIAAAVYRRLIKKQIYGHGMARHKQDEVFHLGKVDLGALSSFLGNSPYFMGEQATSIDASAFGVLVNTLFHPIESPVKEYGLGKENLVAYCHRMMSDYYPELDALPH